MEYDRILQRQVQYLFLFVDLFNSAHLLSFSIYLRFTNIYTPFFEKGCKDIFIQQKFLSLWDLNDVYYRAVDLVVVVLIILFKDVSLWIRDDEPKKRPLVRCLIGRPPASDRAIDGRLESIERLRGNGRPPSNQLPQC